MVVFLTVLLSGLTWGQTDVVTQHYDFSRSGLNPNEVILTPSNVNSSQFGKLFSQTVDGKVYAQPLYVQNVTIPGKGTHNVVFVETENDSVYAFDADSNTGANASPLWQVSVIDAAHGAGSGATPVTSTVVNCSNISPVYGISGTPTIDVSSRTLYLEAMSYENGNVVHRLHALDITTGAEKSPGSILVNPSVAGTGKESVNGRIMLDPISTWNRTGLLLMNGTLYLSFGSHCDLSPWHGWLVAYDASTFALKGVFNTTPNGSGGGIWMAAGAGLAADSSGNIYIATGNGTYDGVTEFSDSVVKLGPLNNGRLPELDFFTPFDQSVFDSQDLDLGSGGVLLLPDQPAGSPRQHLLVAGGKDGTLYVLDRDNLGGFNPNNNNQVWQSFPNSGPALRATPAWWNNNLFVSHSSDYLRAYKFDPLTSTLSGVSTSNSPELFASPGLTPVVSANGTMNAIVWVLQTSPSTILYAYDATNLANELYNSSQNYARDDPGSGVFYSVPLEINGKVYVGTKTQLSVFGELSPTSTTLASSSNPSVSSQSITFTTTITSASGTPTGTVTFKDGATVLGTGTLSSGKAKFTTSMLAVGSHSIAAAYGGAVSYAASTSPVLSQVVNQQATSTAVVPSLNPSTFGQAVTFTATVTAATSGTPGGTVTFKDGATVLGTVAVSNGKATFTTLAVGSHSITAVYGGSVSYAGSTSPVLSQVVNQQATSTAVVSSLNPSTFGQAVTFTATVTAATSGTPGGTVTFKDGATVLGTVAVSNGKATFTTLAVGSHSITAVYGGSVSYAGSTSPVLSQVVN